jgi:hypothetical protein
MPILEFFRKSFKRKGNRKKGQFQIRITEVKIKNKNNWVKAEYLGLSKDISPQGIRLETDAPIELKDVVQLYFSLTKNSKVLQVKAAARRVQIIQKGKREIGFEFIKTSLEVEKYLKTMLILYK